MGLAAIPSLLFPLPFPFLSPSVSLLFPFRFPFFPLLFPSHFRLSSVRLPRRRCPPSFQTPTRGAGGCSSAGRAPGSHPGGQGFEPPQLHVSLPLGVTGNTPDSGSGESWFEPRRGNFKRQPSGCRFLPLPGLGHLRCCAVELIEQLSTSDA